MELNICHLYPDALNLYGDGGNINCLKRRLQWRGIDVTVEQCCVGDTLDAAAHDLFFIGAGQSFEQDVLLEDLRSRKADGIKAAISDGKAFLAICGGMELLGNYHETADGMKADMIGAVDLWTVDHGKRMIGDYVFACDELNGLQIVAFENHAGSMYLGSDVRPLGHIVSGHGNNGTDGLEGARIHNFFGSYGHGCLLPKNPELADHILKTALVRKYGAAELMPLDDSLELAARQFMLDRILAQK